LKRYNFDVHERVLIIFGTNVAQKSKKSIQLNSTLLLNKLMAQANKERTKKGKKEEKQTQR